MAANPRPAPKLDMSANGTGTGTTVQCTGEITSDTCQSLRTIVKPLLSSNKSVVLDFTNVSYVDSSGLGTIVGLYISSKSAGCQLQLVNLTGRVKELFRVTRLGEVDRSLVPNLWED